MVAVALSSCSRSKAVSKGGARRTVCVSFLDERFSSNGGHGSIEESELIRFKRTFFQSALVGRSVILRPRAGRIARFWCSPRAFRHCATYAWYEGEGKEKKKKEKARKGKCPEGGRPGRGREQERKKGEPNREPYRYTHPSRVSPSQSRK